MVLVVACSTPTPDSSTRVAPAEPTARAESHRLEVREVGQGRDVVVLLHGYGARGDDLVALAESLARVVPARFVLPVAPYEGPGRGRAWFEPPRSRMQEDADMAVRAMMGARDRLRATIRSLTYERLVVAGFSQGAMMSLDFALTGDERLDSVVLLSGAPMPTWEGLYRNRAGLPVFLSHGRGDSVIPFSTAQELHRLLSEAGANVHFVPFDGGHSVAPIQQELTGFLRTRLAGPSAEAANP